MIVRPSPPLEPPWAAGKQSPFQVFRWGRLAGGCVRGRCGLFGALFERPARRHLSCPGLRVVRGESGGFRPCHGEHLN